MLQPVADYCIGDNVKLTCTVASSVHSWNIYSSNLMLNVSVAITTGTTVAVHSPFTLRLDSEDDGTITTSVYFTASSDLNRTRINCFNALDSEGEFQSSIVTVLGEFYTE